MYLKSASNSPVTVKGEAMLFVQLGNLHVCIHFVVVDIAMVPLLIGTCFVDMFVKGIFPMERRTVRFWSHPVENISEHVPCRSCWLYYRATPRLRPVLTTDRSIAKEHHCSEFQACHDFAKYGSVCISRKQQRRTHLHGGTPELDAKLNGPTGLR